MTKKKWFVPVEWKELALMTVEAESIEEAIEIANESGVGLAEYSTYQEDSFKVSDMDIEEILSNYN